MFQKDGKKIEQSCKNSKWKSLFQTDYIHRQANISSDQTNDV